MKPQLQETPVMLAAHHGNISVVKFLIASDADLTAIDKV
jgi:ankyrin repeat protein